VGELVLENRSDRGLVVNIVGMVDVNCVSVDVGVLGRVDASEVLVLDEDLAVCRGQRGEGERALKVLTGRGVVEAYRVGLKDVVAVGCRGVDILSILRTLSKASWKLPMVREMASLAVG
jgi:hypothetical protein